MRIPLSVESQVKTMFKRVRYILQVEYYVLMCWLRFMDFYGCLYYACACSLSLDSVLRCVIIIVVMEIDALI